MRGRRYLKSRLLVTGHCSGRLRRPLAPTLTGGFLEAWYACTDVRFGHVADTRLTNPSSSTQPDAAF